MGGDDSDGNRCGTQIPKNERLFTFRKIKNLRKRENGRGDGKEFGQHTADCGTKQKELLRKLQMRRRHNPLLFQKTDEVALSQGRI